MTLCVITATYCAATAILRSHRVTSACLWLRSHRLETLVSYTPMHHTTIHTLAHIELRHFRILYESTSDDQHSHTALSVNHVIGLLCLRYSHAITSAPVYFSYTSVLYHAVHAAQPQPPHFSHLYSLYLLRRIKKEVSTPCLSSLSQPEFISHLSLALHLHACTPLAFLHLGFAHIRFSY